MQPDTIIPDLSNPQSWNRYSYTLNNPINNNDPSGHCSIAVNLGFFGGQVEIKISNGACPWDKHPEPGYDLVVQVPTHEHNGPDLPVRNLSEWGQDVIRLNGLDEYNGPDMPWDDQPLANMSTGQKRPPFPKVNDPRTGENLPEPPSGLVPFDEDDRVPWGKKERDFFINEWGNAGFPEPSGGWDEYQLHHILPRKYGGGNDFWNLVPVKKDVHQQKINPWWNRYDNYDDGAV